MPALSTVAGLALSGASTAGQFIGQKKATKLGKEQEELRKETLRAEQERKRRNTIRQGQIARAQAVNTQAAVGGGELSGSITSGIDANTTGWAASEVGAINTSETYGMKMFDLNSQMASAQSMISTSKGIGNLGSVFMNQNETLGKLFAKEKTNYYYPGGPVWPGV